MGPVRCCFSDRFLAGDLIVPNSALIAFCRAGFESEAGQELVDAGCTVGAYGYFQAQPGQGYVRFSGASPDDASRLLAQTDLQSLVFVRDWFVVLAELALPTRTVLAQSVSVADVGL